MATINIRKNTEIAPYKPIICKMESFFTIIKVKNKHTNGNAMVPDISRIIKLLVIVLYRPNLVSAKNPARG